MNIKLEKSKTALLLNTYYCYSREVAMIEDTYIYLLMCTFKNINQLEHIQVNHYSLISLTEIKVFSQMKLYMELILDLKSLKTQALECILSMIPVIDQLKKDSSKYNYRL